MRIILFLSVTGANPNRRDYGRGLCAEEWARFCGRTSCAEAITKYVHSKKYFLKKTFILTRDKWSSEPDLVPSSRKSRDGDKVKGSWLSRHMSIKKKKRGQQLGTSSPTVSETGKGGSAPELNFPSSPEVSRKTSAAMRRPSCFDHVVPVSIIPKLKLCADDYGFPEEEFGTRMDPPQILKTDFDSDLEDIIV